jgi:thiopeptide-type bacteriocin biosynthesis protein
VIAGDDITTAASRAGLTSGDLADAADAYHLGGVVALEQRDTDRWHQVRVRPIDRDAAEQTMSTIVGPRLDLLVETSNASGWWFMRKEPGWRIRLHDADSAAAELLFNELVRDGTIAAWNPAIYEPETAAFGGDTGTGITHDLFQADTRGLLDYLRRESPPLGRREMSLVLIAAMLKAAGLDWFERGDVFFRVTTMRPPPDLGPAALTELTEQLSDLLSVSSVAESPLFAPGAPVAFASDWRAAFEEAGQRYAAAASSGTLTRGLRAVLAHVLIFHWNRLGLPAATQAILARAAANACLSGD